MIRASNLGAAVLGAWALFGCASTSEDGSGAGQPPGTVGAPSTQTPGGPLPGTTPAPTTPGSSVTPAPTPGTAPQAGAGAPPPVTPPPAMPPPAMPPPTMVTTGVSSTPIDYDDPDLRCYEFRAHAPGNPMQPLMVGVANDRYTDVAFPPPWTGTVYGRSFRTVIDNDQAIHHWLFYKEMSGGSRALVQGWAPGGTDMYFTPDTAMELPDSGYSIQYHYNSSDPSATDTSGLEVCVTPTKPMNVATVSWLGTDAIGGTTASGTCDPRTNERIHILAASPHMHLKGTHMKVTLNRAAGTPEVLHDMPFDFEYQRQYQHDVWVEAGDTITTTCTYNAPSRFGPGTTDEMCYWFAIHYPADGLTDGRPLGALHGPNACLGR